MSITNTSLDRVKATLGVTLPAEYERLVQAIPSDIPDAEECHISTDPEWLIQQNLDLRADPSSFFGREQAWPEYFFLFGEDGNGNAFYLDLREASGPAVYFLDHEEPDVDAVVAASDITEWLNQIRDQLKQYRANALALEKAEHRSPWWQFWR